MPRGTTTIQSNDNDYIECTCRVGLIVASVAKISFFYSQSTYWTMLIETVVWSTRKRPSLSCWRVLANQQVESVTRSLRRRFLLRCKAIIEPMKDQESKKLLLWDDGCQSEWFLSIKMLFKLLVVSDSGEDKHRERLEYLESELACEIIV
jgi:hypothetical protein